MPDASQQSSLPRFRVLSLDGGGAKGFYTLGVLDELEKNTGKPIHECFDLIFGTSTGSIIAALLARGDTVQEILKSYGKHVPVILRPRNAAGRTKALIELAKDVFAETAVAHFKVKLGIVATNWKDETPFIFKTSVDQAHASEGSFVPFFGCSVADAIVSSCSAYPFFKIHTVTKSNGDVIQVADGGFCANNPTLYALAEATLPLKQKFSDISLVSVGVGSYPEPAFWRRIHRLAGDWGMIRHGFNSDFLQKLLGINTCSMETLRFLLFKSVQSVRISDSFVEPEMATDFLEHDLTKLNRLVQKGRRSYAKYADDLKKLLAS
jgi:hypothetical protein